MYIHKTADKLWITYSAEKSLFDEDIVRIRDARRSSKGNGGLHRRKTEKHDSTVTHVSSTQYKVLS